MILLPVILFLMFIYITPPDSVVRGSPNQDETKGVCCQSPALRGYIVLPISFLLPLALFIVVSMTWSKGSEGNDHGDADADADEEEDSNTASSSGKAIMILGIILTLVIIVCFVIFGTSGVRNGMTPTTKTACTAAGGIWCTSCDANNASITDNFLGCGCGLSTGLVTFVLVFVPLVFTILAMVVVYHKKRGISAVYNLQANLGGDVCSKPYQAAMKSSDSVYIQRVLDFVNTKEKCSGLQTSLNNRLEQLEASRIASGGGVRV